MVAMATEPPQPQNMIKTNIYIIFWVLLAGKWSVNNIFRLMMQIRLCYTTMSKQSLCHQGVNDEGQRLWVNSVGYGLIR